MANIAVFAPMPNAIVMTVTAVKPGDLANVRKAKRQIPHEIVQKTPRPRRAHLFLDPLHASEFQ